MNRNRNKNKNKPYTISGVMWRFSSVIFIPIVIIMAVTYMPVQWLITGRYFLKEKGWTNWLYRWGKKIGFD